MLSTPPPAGGPAAAARGLVSGGRSCEVGRAPRCRQAGGSSGYNAIEGFIGMACFRGSAAIFLAVVFAFPLFGLAPAAMAQDPDEAQDPEVARVDGEPILMSQVLEFAATLPAQYEAQFEQVLPFIIDRLIDFRLLDRAAEGTGLAEDEEVKARVAELTINVVREVYLQRYVAGEVTDAALRARYEAHLAENPPAEEVSARHILVENEEDARAIIAELDAGGDFATLATDRSTGPSATQGGDLGYFTDGQMVPAFSEAAFAMEPGSYTADPVETQFGWHVIFVEDQRLQAPPAFEDLEGQLSEELQRAAIDTLLAGLRAGAEIEVFNGETAEGGAEAAEVSAEAAEVSAEASEGGAEAAEVGAEASEGSAEAPEGGSEAAE